MFCLALRWDLIISKIGSYSCSKCFLLLAISTLFKKLTLEKVFIGVEAMLGSRS